MTGSDEQDPAAILEAARAEAERIVAEARSEAERVRSETQAWVDRIADEVDRERAAILGEARAAREGESAWERFGRT